MASISVRHSATFDIDIIDGQFDIVLDYYFDWCNINGLVPKFTIDSNMDELSDEDFEYVLVKANIQGLHFDT